MHYQTFQRQIKVSLEAASHRRQDAESLGFASLVASVGRKLPRSRKFPIDCRLANRLSQDLKSFARAFSKARRVEGRSPSWVLRATPLTSLAFKGRTKSALRDYLAYKRNLSADKIRRLEKRNVGLRPKVFRSLRRATRALPLTYKLLKKLEQNF